MSADLEMLIARLRWPIGATRWWAMQELATLLLCPETRGEVSKRLLLELASCRLEAEGVELIYIFWMAAKQGGKLPSDLVSALTRPSLLAALLLSDTGLALNAKAAAPPLEVAPKDFEESARFREVQGIDVPRNYLSRLEQLERNTGLPFVRQAAFEWSKTDETYPTAPIQGDLGYFVRPIGNGGLTGCFASRALLRMTSAYQRTLEVARTHWGLPEKTALYLAADALPLDPTLALLRPVRPSWLPNLGEQINADAESAEALIRNVVNSIATTQPDAVLLSLTSPIFVDSREIVELSVVRWRKWGAIAVAAHDLAGRFFDRQEDWDYGVCRAREWGLTSFVPMAKLDNILDHETNAAPMACVYGFNRIGYLQKDLYPARLYYPVITGFSGELSIEPSGSELKISAAHGHVATLYNWNAGWSPVHPAPMSGLCGTALVGTENNLQAQTEAPPDSHFYLWRVTRLKRTYGYEPFVADDPVYGII